MTVDFPLTCQMEKDNMHDPAISRESNKQIKIRTMQDLREENGAQTQIWWNAHGGV